MNLIQVHTLLIQSVKTTLKTVKQSLSMLFYEMDDVKHCSIGVSFSDAVCPGYPEHSNTVFKYVVLRRMM